MGPNARPRTRQRGGDPIPKSPEGASTAPNKVKKSSATNRQTKAKGSGRAEGDLLLDKAERQASQPELSPAVQPPIATKNTHAGQQEQSKTQKRKGAAPANTSDLAPLPNPAPKRRSDRLHAAVHHQQNSASGPAPIEELEKTKNKDNKARSAAFADLSFSSSTETWVYTALLPEQITPSKYTMAPPSDHAMQNDSNFNGRGTTARATEPASATSKKTSTTYKGGVAREELSKGVGRIRMYFEESDRFDGTELDHGLTMESMNWVEMLKKDRPEDHNDTLFPRQSVTPALKRLQNKNESAVSHELHELVCPPACRIGERSFRDPDLQQKYRYLADAWNQTWKRKPPNLNFPAPVPDYCVGFSSRAFTRHQQDKLLRAAEGGRLQVFTPLNDLYFPFLTCEVKAPGQSIDHAENQNAHSAFVAVRSTMDFLRTANPTHDVSGELMAFSISYNNRHVSVHAYYPVVDGDRTDICRRELYDHVLTPTTNPTWWKSREIVRNIYEVWAPDFLRRISAVIDEVDIQQWPSGTSLASASVNRMDVDGSVSTVRPNVRSTRSNAGSSNKRPATEPPNQARSRKKAGKKK